MNSIKSLRSSFDAFHQTSRKSEPGRCSLTRVFTITLAFIGILNGAITSLSKEPLKLQLHEDFRSTVEVREIATSLKAPFPDQFTVLQPPEYNGFGALSGGSEIRIGKELADSLRDDTHTEYTREEARGVLAHEMAHGILGHSENNHPAYAEHAKAEKNGLSLSEQDLIYSAASRVIEKEADLYTLHVPTLAKGLINRFKRSIINKPPEVAQPDDFHPPTEERIDYLTKGYCKTVKGDDLDLCNHCPSNTTV